MTIHGGTLRPIWVIGMPGAEARERDGQPAFGSLADGELVRACLDGHTDAFDVIVERHRRTVYRLCYRFVSNHEDANDLSQDVFLPAELQRLFDAYVLVQAQDVLQLTETQYPQFLARLRALQDVRRRAQAERSRIIAELRNLAERGRTDASTRDRIPAQLKALRDLESRRQSEEQQAIEKIDDVLEPVQQARLRVFEEQMERRKLELLVRARQSARARRAR